MRWYTNILLEADEEDNVEGEDYQLDERPETEEELTANDEPDPTEGITGEEDGTEEGGEGTDYQLDERPETEDELTGDETTDDVTGEGETTDEASDYQLDGEGGDMEEPTGDTEENVDGEISGDGMEDDGSGDLDDTKKEKYKKMVLLDDYKELYNISISLQKSCENLNDKTNIKNKRMYNYLDNKITQLIDKISFTIRIMFMSEEYKKLLTLFYHYKIQINDIVKLFEFLIQSEEE